MSEEEKEMSKYGSAETVNDRNASLSGAFREIGNAFLIHVMNQSGDRKGTNNKKAKVETDLEIHQDGTKYRG